MSRRDPGALTPKQLAGRIRAAQHPRAALAAARGSLPATSIPTLVRELTSSPALALRTLTRPFPRTVEQLHSRAPLPPLPLAMEAMWTAALLHAERRTLRILPELRERFEATLLADDYDAASAALDEVESHFGQSIWLISRRLLVIQLKEGLGAQKKWADALVARLHYGALPAFLTFFLSVRSEPSVTPPMLRRQIETSLESSQVSAQLRAYLKFRLLAVAPSTALASSVLAREQTASLVDCYDTLLSILQTELLAANDEASHELEEVTSLLRDTFPNQQVSGLHSIAVSDEKTATFAGPSIGPIADAYLRGEYEAGYNSALQILAQTPSCHEALLLAARGLAILERDVTPTGPLSTRTVARLGALMSGGPAAVDDLSELVKLGIAFGTSGVGAAILMTMQDESSASVFITDDAIRHSGLPLLTASSFYPFLADLHPAGRSQRIVATRLASVSSHQASRATLLVTGAPPGNSTEVLDIASADECALILALAASANGRPADVLQLAERLTHSRVSYFKRKGSRLLINALLDLHRHDDAVRTLTSTYVADNAMVRLLPVRRTLEEVQATHTELTAADVSVPILFDMHAQHVDSSNDTALVFAYEDFLAAHSVERPSQLEALVERFDHAKIVYFLRNICVEAVMDRTASFTSSKEVLEERLAVCRLLLQIDTSHSDKYHDEIKAINKRLLLSRRMRQLDQSKIYVDVDSLRRKLEPELRDTYIRYISLRREGLVASPLDSSRLPPTEASTDLSALRLPSQDTADLLRALIDRIRDEYATSPEYGLDKYLSVRVRHGTLVYHLRRPVEAAHLLTPRDEATNTYRPNTYWPSRLPTPVEVDPALVTRLAEFSASYDGLVDEIRSWLHVSTTADPVGLFSFGLPTEYYTALSRGVSLDTPYASFVDGVVAVLDQVLDERLAVVRSALERTASPAASSLLDDLARDVEEMCGESAGPLINSIRGAKADLQSMFDRVSSWFRRAVSAGAEPFSVEEAIDIGVESVKTIHPSFSHQALVDFDDELVIHGAFLTVFVDILFIVLENITKHSATFPPHAHISARLRGSTLTIQIENAVAANVANEDTVRRVADLRSGIFDQANIGFVRREGGSGLHKLARILQHDLSGESRLEFGFKDGPRFYVSLDLHVERVPYEDSAG